MLLGTMGFYLDLSTKKGLFAFVSKVVYHTHNDFKNKLIKLKSSLGIHKVIRGKNPL